LFLDKVNTSQMGSVNSRNSRNGDTNGQKSDQKKSLPSRNDKTVAKTTTQQSQKNGKKS
jgi:hypothetical protein